MTNGWLVFVFVGVLLSICNAQFPGNVTNIVPPAGATFFGNVISGVTNDAFWTAYYLNATTVGITQYTRQSPSAAFLETRTLKITSLGTPMRFNNANMPISLHVAVSSSTSSVILVGLPMYSVFSSPTYDNIHSRIYRYHQAGSVFTLITTIEAPLGSYSLNTGNVWPLSISTIDPDWKIFVGATYDTTRYYIQVYQWQSIDSSYAIYTVIATTMYIDVTLGNSVAPVASIPGVGFDWPAALIYQSAPNVLSYWRQDFPQVQTIYTFTSNLTIFSIQADGLRLLFTASAANASIGPSHVYYSERVSAIAYGPWTQSGYQQDTEPSTRTGIYVYLCNSNNYTMVGYARSVDSHAQIAILDPLTLTNSSYPYVAVNYSLAILPGFFGKMINTHNINISPNGVVMGVPGNASQVGGILYVEHPSICTDPSIPPIPPIEITYLTSLVLPPVGFGYNYYAATIFSTSTGNGIAAIGHSVITGHVFAVVYERATPEGGYSMRQQIPITGPVGITMTLDDQNERTTVRLSDDMNRLIIMPASGTSTTTIAFNTTAMVFVFNAALYAYELVQTMPFANARALDMTRDGLTLIIAANDTSIFHYKLGTTNTATLNAGYLLVQNITVSGYVDLVTLDAYGRVFAANIDDEVHMFHVIDGNQFGHFYMKQTLSIGAYHTGIKISGNGQRLFIQAYDLVYLDGVFSSYFNTQSQSWVQPMYVNITTDTFSAISASDSGNVIIVPYYLAQGRYALYTCPSPSSGCSFGGTLPSLPWELSGPATDYYGPTNLYSLTADCRQIVSGTLVLESTDPPLGNGQPILYSTSLNCTTTPHLPPFIPPTTPQPPGTFPPIQLDPPIDVPLPPIAPIAAPPRSPNIAPNYAPPTTPVTPEVPLAPDAPLADNRTLAIVSLVMSVFFAVAAIAYIIHFIVTKARANGYAKGKQLK